MAVVDPIVRHMILCDDVRPDPADPHRLDILGFATNLRAIGDIFPTIHPELCALVMLTEVRWEGHGRIVVVAVDSSLVVFTGADHVIRPGAGPLDVMGVVFRLRDCPFPSSGLYEVQFRYNGRILAQQPLLVR